MARENEGRGGLCLGALTVRKCAVETLGFCKRKAFTSVATHTPFASPVNPTALKTLTRVPVHTHPPPVLVYAEFDHVKNRPPTHGNM